MSKYLDESGLGYLWGKIKSYISGLGFYTKPSTGIPATDIASGVIPTVPTSLSAFTDDLGSSPTHTHSQYLTSAPVTSVNGQTGAVSLTIPDVSGKENTTNKVTSLSSSSTDTQYPSAKCVYDLIGDVETILASI